MTYDWGAFVGEYQRNIKVYKVEEITSEFDTKTKFDDEKDN